MRRFVLVLLFVNFTLVAYNQIIRGNILSMTDNKPIHFASIYFNGTFVGTHSDQNGYFELDVTKYKSMSLTVSALGYYSVTLADFLSDKPVLVHMNPKVFELKEVIISGRTLSKTRKGNLILFREAFLGTTVNASHCKILNEEDIQFYDLESDTLRAYSSGPIQIENSALGYKVTYFLDEFELDKKTKDFFFIGNIVFNEDLGIDEKQKFYDRKRKYSYLGSRMHFFRVLWINDFRSAGFEVRSSKNKILDYNDIVVEEDNPAKFLCYPERLVIYYQSTEPAGYINFLKEEVQFDRSGYFDPLGISWEGLIVRKRIADWLPYEYAPTK